MFPILAWFIVPTKYLNGGRFPIRIDLPAFIIDFLNSLTGGWSIPYFTSAEFSSKSNYFNAFYTSFHIQYSVVLLYRDILLHSHIFLAFQIHIINCYWNSLSLYLCTTWGKLSSDLYIFQSTLIRYYIEIWYPQILSVLTNFPPHWGCFSDKAVSWILQWWNLCSFCEKN